MENVWDVPIIDLEGTPHLLPFCTTAVGVNRHFVFTPTAVAVTRGANMAGNT